MGQCYDNVFFFNAYAMNRHRGGLDYEVVELRKIYRQSDPEFIRLLNQVRLNQMTPQALSLLNSHYSPTAYTPLQGIILRSRIYPNAIKVDPQVVNFLSQSEN